MNASDHTRDFLLLRAGGQRFALPSASVTEAVAPRAVTPLPFVPPFIEGLVNINERVLPQVDLRRLLFAGTPVAARADDEVVVADTARAPCALRVDRIVGRASVAAADLQAIDDGDGAGSTLFTCRFDHDGDTVLVLDVDRLGNMIVARDTPAGQRGLLGRLPQDERAAQQRGELPCVVVRAGDEHHAIALGDTLEILDAPAATPIPGAPPVVEGVAVVRDDVLLVLSLPRLLRRGDNEAAARQVVVIARGDVRYGLRVDAVEGIVAFDPDALRPVDDEGSEVTGVLVRDGRLFGLLSPRSLLPDTRHASLLPFVPGDRRRGAERAVARQSVLQVTLGNEDYGIPLDAVRRIARYSAPEAIEHAGDSLVSGAVNIDGAIVPVVDIATHLSLATRGDAGAWVIVGNARGEWAIPVGSARDIIDIPVTDIEELGQRQRGFVTAVATVNRRLLSLLTLAPLDGNAGAAA